MISSKASIHKNAKIGKNVKIGGNSGVLKNIENNVKVMGYPAIEMKKFIKKNLNDR